MKIRVRSLLLTVVMALASSPAASVVTIDWTPVGNPGNACDPVAPGFCWGAVGYTYSIGTYEVTNAQYAEFLNAKAANDTLELYDPEMGGGFGGITQSGCAPDCSYAAIAGRENMPVNYVGVYDAMRFANWLYNGQGSGDTETGAYTLEGGTPTPDNGSTVIRNGTATTFLPSDEEWYKAAYYNGSVYFDYPAGSNTQTTCATPNATANQANCNNAVGDLTPVGSYSGTPGSPSPFGTYDQAGNVFEITDTLEEPGLGRIVRGGHFAEAASWNGWFGKRGLANPELGSEVLGFRVARLDPAVPDTDGDGIPDVLDTCMLDSRNAVAPATCDSDCDGYGNVCDPDFDQNFTTSAADFGTYFIPAFKGLDPSPWPQGMDLDCNGTVSSSDFGQYFVPKFKGLFPVGGATPGPSGLGCAGTPGCSGGPPPC